jgi:hypothetical protein
MSWFLGIVAPSLSASVVERLSGIHSSPSKSSRNTNYYIAFGGLADTCCTSSRAAENDSPYQGWGVLGLGMRVSATSRRLLTPDDWTKIFSVPKPDFSSLDGHFTAVRWRSGAVELFTDQVGGRTAYVADTDMGIVFHNVAADSRSISGPLALNGFRSVVSHTLRRCEVCRGSDLEAWQLSNRNRSLAFRLRGVRLRRLNLQLT